MAEGMQITIPDFDDDDYSSVPIPFGRSGAFGHGHGFGSSSAGHNNVSFSGSGGGGNGSGHESPTTLSNPGEGSRFFASHTRDNSVASEDSSLSSSAVYGNLGTGRKGPFGHSSQGSIGNNVHNGNGSSMSVFGAGNISGIANPSLTKESGPSFTKKTSFASLKNAFKSKTSFSSQGAGGSGEVPPVPPLDPGVYPVLKNPFNRSNTSLTQAGTGGRGPGGGGFGTNSTSPPSGRPQTPSENRTKGTPSRSKTLHGYGRSQHSHNGSLFHVSDAGSDHGGYLYVGSPPPVPKVPNAFGAAFGHMAPLDMSNGLGMGLGEMLEEDRVIMDLKTPSDFALHAVFIRFASAAEVKIDTFLRKNLESDPLMSDLMGPGVDKKFDDLLFALGKIALKHAKPVIDSIMRWRRSQNENVGSEFVRLHAAVSPTTHRAHQPSRGDPNSSSLHNISFNAASGALANSSFTSGANGNGPANGSGAIRMHDIPALLNERKSLASIYIMCRALLTVLKSISTSGARDALSEQMGFSLEETIFEQVRRPELRPYATHLSSSTSVNHPSSGSSSMTGIGANHRSNAELFARLLGLLANLRFVSVTDRFVGELGPVAQGGVQKDISGRFEGLVRGLRHVHLKVWPPEAFDECAEFMESLSKSFANAHGLRLKIAFAETLVQLLHPMGKTAQAEVNHPVWRKAIEVIFPKAREMMAKPRYWNAAFPLAVTSLCVAPHDIFLKHFLGMFEGGLSKLKEKPSRTPVLNGMMRLIWTYMYRAQDSGSMTTSKLESLLRNFFPPNRTTIFPPEDSLELFIYIVHFILSRHPDFGRDVCLDLLNSSGSGSTSGGTGTQHQVQIAPERTSIVVQATLLSLHVLEREESTPSWPSSYDFFSLPPWEDYPSSSEIASPALVAKQGFQEYFDKFGSTLATLVLACNSNVGSISIFDDQWSASRLPFNATSAGIYDDTLSHNSNGYVVRRHQEGMMAAYPKDLMPYMSVMGICFKSWPRALHSTIGMVDAVDMLLKGLVNVEPAIGDAAASALRRMMKDGGSGGQTLTPGQMSMSQTVLVRFANFLFSPMRIARETSGTKLLAEYNPLLNLWISLVEEWVNRLIEGPAIKKEEVGAAMLRSNEIESGALFLMTHVSWSVRCAGARLMKILMPLAERLSEIADTSLTDEDRGNLSFILRLSGKGMDRSYLDNYEDVLNTSELGRLELWRNSPREDILLRMAESPNEKDRKLLQYVFPKFMLAFLDFSSVVMTSYRETVCAAVTKCHPVLSYIAGMSGKVPVGFNGVKAGQSIDREKEREKLVQENLGLIDQWHVWVKVLCKTATLSESKPALTSLGREHTRAPSDTNFEKERLTTTRGLFRYLTPYLDSEYECFRDAAVLCISSLPSSAYPQLLEDLSLLASRQFYDDPRTKVSLAASDATGGLSAREDIRSRSGSILSLERSRRQERLHSAVGRIYYLTGDLLQYQRGAGRQAALANVLKFVRKAQGFLTSSEARDNYSLQRLRRYFCGTVERLFDGLATLKDSDRFTPHNMHLSLYRMCEEWCQFGPQSELVKHRLVVMQKAAVAASNMPNADPDTLERFQQETVLLSGAAVGALSSLCQKAYFPPETSSGSPTEKALPEHSRPLVASATLERVAAILSSSQPLMQARGKKALRSLLSFDTNDTSLLEEALRRAFVTTKQLDTSCGRFFEVVAEVICSSEGHHFSFAQVVCLGLSNLCHSLTQARRIAFNMLEAIHEQSAGILSMSQFEGAAGSMAPTTYLHAHHLVSDFLAGEHPHQASNVLAQFCTWLPQIHDVGGAKHTLMLLQSLEFWVPNLDLLLEDKSGPSRQGLAILYNMLVLSLRYGQSHAEQILALWARLVESPHEANGQATIQFLLEQSHKIGNPIFITCASNLVACLCQTPIGKQIFSELCSIIEPARMLPTIDHKLAHPDSDTVEMWSDLDTLFGEQPRIPLSTAQFALLFLADVCLERSWDLHKQLPVLLHAIFIHMDHRSHYIREQVQRMLFFLLRSWMPGYDELPNRAEFPNRPALKATLANLEKEASSRYWKEDETSSQSEPKMSWLCGQVIDFLEPLSPKLAERWGSLALTWGTVCSIRPVAFRSLQIFRALMSMVTKSELSLLLGRLTNTISATDSNIQSFTSEIILTLKSMVVSGRYDPALLPQLFWSVCACLSTTVECEYAQVLDVADALLSTVDLDDPATIKSLSSHKPPNWSSDRSFQSLLITGLRSSVTSTKTMKILQKLASFENPTVIDETEGRVRDLYTIGLPWCLEFMGAEPRDESLFKFAENVGRLANAEGRTSINKIMTSFAKGRFRTKDDFLRQAVASLREHYGVDHWDKVITLLMGLMLNREPWLRMQTMQILKVLFQQRETRNPVDLLGSELLMPLLRLLDTDLAPLALDVLEEPLMISGGLAAKHVLRMSMRVRSKDAESVGVLFGVPEESGWCVAQMDDQRHSCRANVLAVFNTCMIAASRPSQITFEPETEAVAYPLEEDLGDLVQNLHELTTFFQEDEPSKIAVASPPPSEQLEARVAAILAKSTSPNDSSAEHYTTPFSDAFRISHSGVTSSEESDDESDSDSEDDAFVFDSPSVYRTFFNGSRVH